MLDQARERGSFVDDREDNYIKFFAIASKVNPDTDGMSLVDFFAIMGASSKYMLAKKEEIEAKEAAEAAAAQ